MRRILETDVCIIGSGISAAMVAEKLAEERNARIVVVEAGDEMPAVKDWYALRKRFLDYGESPWPRDHLDDTHVAGIQSRSMCVGGLAMHWGGVTPRFSPEDFKTKSLCGVGEDWPISYEDLDQYYQEAEVRMGVAGEQGPPTSIHAANRSRCQNSRSRTTSSGCSRGWRRRVFRCGVNHRRKTRCRIAAARHAVATTRAHRSVPPAPSIRPMRRGGHCAPRDGSRSCRGPWCGA